MEKKLSLVIPVYGTEKYLKRCLDSIIKQSWPEIEIIIVNDCSPGNVTEIVNEYKKKYSNIVYCIHEKNKGLFQARITGAEKATGTYIAFLDSDDYVTRDFYRSLILKAETEQADIVIGRTILEKPDGTHFVYSFHDQLLRFDSLEGDEIQHKFWDQEGLCYSWHTIWNKLYTKKLWDMAEPYYKRIQTHVTMTEDIAFSSVLFYFAQKVVSVSNDGYFYCQNQEASTNADNLPIKKYIKNIQDITVVFDFVESFLEEQGTSEFIKKQCHAFRQYYAKLWKNHALTTYSGNEKLTALKSIDLLFPNLDEAITPEDHFFNTVLSPWNGGLEYAKDLIASTKFQWISFDIFDTLITRPLYSPEDIFHLMNPLFEKLMSTSASFQKIRIDGEKTARDWWGKKYPADQDITLTQIYDVIAKYYKIPLDIAYQMMNEEVRLEVELSSIRSSGKELFDFAHAIGKKVILVSDMYLEREKILDILAKHNINGFEALFLSSEVRLTKNTGRLFEFVLKQLKVNGSSVLHIGDTWNSDIENPKKLGIETFFLPKAKDVMENRIQGVLTNQCAHIGDYACSDIVNRKKYWKSLGYGAMFSIVANTYFDNPYRYFNPNTDFNQDPYLIGYYPIGMHLVGFCKWMIEEAQKYGYKKLYFMSRDGYLPMLVYQQVSSLYSNAPKAEYLYTSRKALMPYMLENTYDFYDLPIEVVNHTPRTVLSLLEFCTKKVVDADIINQLKLNGLGLDVNFKGKNELYTFITLYLEHWYDTNKHEEAKKRCREYYQQISQDSATVDMGYSGRIQGALSASVGHGVDVFFVHADNYQYQTEMRKHNFKIHAFYDYMPCMTGLFREHLFSSFEPSCVGFSMQNGKIVPSFDNEEKTYQERFVTQLIQKGAIDFAKKFVDKLGKYYSLLPFKAHEVSLPYEGMLRYIRREDLKIFDASFFEDMVYGARRKIKISDFIYGEIQEYNITNQLASSGSESISFSDMLIRRMKGKNRLLKFAVYLMADKENFKTRIWFSLQDKPLLFRMSRWFYRRVLK